MSKQRKNCWETMNCGREQGGVNVGEKGVCPAAQSNKYDGINSGEYAGRFCWAISGTFCLSEKKGVLEQEFKDCLQCKHFQGVVEEEDRSFKLCIEDVKREGEI